jgi:ABC-type multidrug transport system fused ATPase/permease subunit
MGMKEAANGADRIYAERSEHFAAARARCAARSRWLAHARLVAFIAAAVPFLWSLDPGARFGAAWLASVIALPLLFLGLVLLHNRLKRRCEWYDQLVDVNEEGRRRIARDWKMLRYPDDDEPKAGDPYASDLDLFGHGSLSGLLATVGTAPGRSTLREFLLEPATSETVRERQAAVAELAPLIDLREEITVRGRLMPVTVSAGTENFLRWAEGDPWLSQRRGVVWTARLLTLLTAALIALNIADLVSYTAWLTMLGVNLAFTYSLGTKLHGAFNRAFAREGAFQQYAEVYRLLSTTHFSTPLLRHLQSRLTAGGLTAHTQMERLHRLASLSEVRYSMLYVPIQAFTLWDFHVLLRLERWQATAGRHARDWTAALGIADALAALSTLHFENVDWVFPEITDDDSPVIRARGLGHPLIPDDERVVNDVRIGPPGRFLLVTGSNMSGKSTLLRAIGTNVVLARAGAPVCAAAMRLPPLRIESSMRVHDSLQQGLSHFMAELQRLKGVLDAARNVNDADSGTVLYLLDDIFQGTNTAERRIAARTVVAHLLKTPAIGAVTSHDLQLADTEELSTAADPVHFSETIEKGPEGPRISFDYKLRPGMATSQNALKLLEIVGLADEPDGDENALDRRQV